MEWLVNAVYALEKVLPIEFAKPRKVKGINGVPLRG
jgi:hypothetical protein